MTDENNNTPAPDATQDDALEWVITFNRGTLAVGISGPIAPLEFIVALLDQVKRAVERDIKRVEVVALAQGPHLVRATQVPKLKPS